jgi:hypothetical protein
MFIVVLSDQTDLEIDSARGRSNLRQLVRYAAFFVRPNRSGRSVYCG